jgi:sulfur carrier protein
MIRVNGETEPFLDESVEALLDRRQIEKRGIAVAVDGLIVQRSTWALTPVPDNSSIEIVTAAAGG